MPLTSWYVICGGWLRVRPWLIVLVDTTHDFDPRAVVVVVVELWWW